jgi:probable addiction module antidote protein
MNRILLYCGLISKGKHSLGKRAKQTIPYEEILYQDLQDPAEAAAYLNAALEDESQNRPEIFLLALRDVAKARGIRQIAQDTQLSRESLYRTLSRKGNPRFSTLEAVLESVGLKLAVEVKQPETRAVSQRIA